MPAYADTFNGPSNSIIYVGMTGGTVNPPVDPPIDPPVDPPTDPGIVYSNNPNTVLVGDSLTDVIYGQTTWYVVNGASGGKLRNILNLGVQGETVGQILARIDNPYNGPNPGLAGIQEPVNFIHFRAGANNTRGGATITEAIKQNYRDLLAKFLTYANRVFVHSVTPMVGSQGAGVPSFNAFLESVCDESGGLFIWVPDYKGYYLPDGVTVDPDCFTSDGLHFSSKGIWKGGIEGAPYYTAALLPHNIASPLSTSAADKYPAQPQWIKNHLNTGTGGSVGNLTGVSPTGWNYYGYGSGISGVCSVKAADAGDANQTPWARLNVTQVTQPGTAIWISADMEGRSITGTDPKLMELVYEVRFTNFDANAISAINAYVQANTGNKLSQDLNAKFGGAGRINKTLILRQSAPRNETNSATSAHLQMELIIGAAASGDLGYIDIRCATVRG